MCTFLSTLPKKSKTAGTNTKRSLVLSLRPCPDTETEKTWYRFRLLNFSSKTSDRDHPFIQRYIHQVWGVNDKNNREIKDEVVCPVTKWVEWEGNRYETCPMCKYAGQQYNTLRESNWKDSDAKRKNRDFSRKFQAIIPVYVVSDPNYEGNNGKFKVIIFNDKKFYDEFIKKIEKQLLKVNCFNGVNAVDTCMHVENQTIVVNEGQPNQYNWTQKVIDKICFSKPYNLPAITKEAVDEFPFDETYYVSSTKEEIKSFYNKYIKVSNDDIIEDDEDSEIQVYNTPSERQVSKTNTIKQNKFENTEIESNDDEDLNDDISETFDLSDDDEDEDLDSTELHEQLSMTKTAKDIESDLDINELLNGLDDI